MPRGAVLALGVLVVLAGCGGPGAATPQPISADASKATVGSGALDSTGYEEAHVRQEPFNDTGRITVQGDVEFDVEYNFDGTAWSVVYHGTGSPRSVFAVYSVPQVRPEQVEIEVNPLNDRSPAEVATLAQDRYTDLEDLVHVDNRTVTLLGTETGLARYTATATADGDSVDVVVHIAMVRDGTDVVVGVAVYPEGADEESAVVTLVEAIEHSSS